MDIYGLFDIWRKSSTGLTIYLIIGAILTIYWNRDNDGLIGLDIIFWPVWPIFGFLYIVDFLVDRRWKHGR